MDEYRELAIQATKEQARIRVMPAEEYMMYVQTLERAFRSMDIPDGADAVWVEAARRATNVLAATPMGYLGQGMGLQSAPMPQDAQAQAPERKPACSPKRSIRDDVVICLECGRRTSSLTRNHLAKHGLTPEEYKAKWGLKPNQHLVSRQALAKQRELVKRMTDAQAAKRAAAQKGELPPADKPKPKAQKAKPAAPKTAEPKAGGLFANIEG
jgi:predicted transcriptional regulator